MANPNSNDNDDPRITTIPAARNNDGRVTEKSSVPKGATAQEGGSAFASMTRVKKGESTPPSSVSSAHEQLPTPNCKITEVTAPQVTQTAEKNIDVADSHANNNASTKDQHNKATDTPCRWFIPGAFRAPSMFDPPANISRDEYRIIANIVSGVKNFQELEAALKKEFTFSNPPAASTMEADASTPVSTPTNKSTNNDGATPSSDTDDKGKGSETEKKQVAFRFRHTLQRLLTVIRTGTLDQQEAAYRVCAEQWVLLARTPSFPVNDKAKAYRMVFHYQDTTRTAPHAVKTRINALIMFLEGSGIDTVTKSAPLPYPFAPPPVPITSTIVPKWGHELPVEKIVQHPETTSGFYGRLAMDKDGKPRFVCIVNGCQRSYASSNCLVRHQIQHFELYACPACPQTFYSRTDHIQKHWEQFHPNRPRRDLEKTLELMYRNGGAPPALKMWVNGVIWSRKADGIPRRRNMKRKYLDALRDTERAGYVAQKLNWQKIKGLKEEDEVDMKHEVKTEGYEQQHDCENRDDNERISKKAKVSD